jgi:Family of unknown function (DUF6364)
MSKLTLTVDDAVILRAKRYAKKQGISVSKMVEAYLAAVAEPPVRTRGYADPAFGNGRAKEVSEKRYLVADERG